MDCGNCRRFAEENERLTDELSGMLMTTRKQAASLAALERELRQTRSEDPVAREIKYVLSEWRSLTGHLRAAIDEASDRWPLVKRQLKRRELQDCLWTVRGMAIAPYMHYGHYRVGPCGKPDCCKRRNDIKDVFGNDSRFEELLDVGRRAEQATSVQLLTASQMVWAQEHLLYRLTAEAEAREDAKRLIELSLPREEWERRYGPDHYPHVVDIGTRRRNVA